MFDITKGGFMPMNFYLARQPILDHKQEIIGYELLYRDSEKSAVYANERHATAALLVNVLNQAGLHNVVGDQQAFVNIDDRFLRHEIIDTIPPETFIFELTSRSNLDDLTVERIEVLFNKGYKFCLDATDYSYLSEYQKLLPYLTFCKIDTRSFEEKYIDYILEVLHKKRISTIATKVEDEVSFEKYKDKNFDAFQGYYFAKPKIIKDQQLDVDQASMFHVSNLLQTGGEISEIVLAFEKSPTLIVQLLRFINSAAFHFRNRISSINQVVTLLGRKSLIQWLMLLLYSKTLSSKASYENPLILMVKHRTSLMVSLLKILKPESSLDEQSQAYFVGVFSLMDTLLHMPLEKILEEFQVDDNVKEALFDKKGRLGELYDMVLAIEHFQTEKIDAFIEEHQLNKREFEHMLLDSIQATTEFSRATSQV